MEILCKLYLELATVVPPDCVSMRERVLQARLDRFRDALIEIADGSTTPRDVAARALLKTQAEG